MFGAIIFIVWYGIRLTVNDVISPKDLLSFLFYTVFVAASIGGIAEQLAAIQRAIGATERVMDIIDDIPEAINLDYEKGEHNKRLEGYIEFNNVSFVYPSRPEFQVLNNVSL